MPERVLFSPKEVAEMIGVNENTLYKWRAAGIGPPFLRLNDGVRAGVRYERDVLRAWLRERVAEAE